MRTPHDEAVGDVPPMTHAEVVGLAARWARGKCGVVLPEFVSSIVSEIPDVLAFNSRDSYMIEVKVSRSDFLRDKTKMFRRFEDRGMGNYRYYCCPRKLIGVLEVPDGWGLIWVYPDGKARQVLAPDRKKRNKDAEHSILFSYARRAVVKGLHAEIMKPMPKPDIRPMHEIVNDPTTWGDKSDVSLDDLLSEIDSAA